MTGCFKSGIVLQKTKGLWYCAANPITAGHLVHFGLMLEV